MSPQRRRLLYAITGIGVGFVGCSNTEETGGRNPETPTDSAESNLGTQNIHVSIHNHLSQAIIVSVELSTERTEIIDDEVRVDANGFTSLDTEIDETGQYDINLILNNREKNISVDIVEYDLEMGSDIIFWIDEEDILYGKEE
jgi:hypothetical protein